MTHPSKNLIRQRRSLLLVVIMFALGMRVLYAPVHLAQDEHFQSGGHQALHADESDEQASDGHDHDQDHPPHPALDHASDLIVRRTVGPRLTLEPCALVEESEVVPGPAARSTGTGEPTAGPPRSRPRAAPSSRGPPATA